jgi:hypothetical protein
MNGVQMDVLTVNGQGMVAAGSVAQRLLQNGMNPSALRPWQEFGPEGQFLGNYINVNGRAVPIGNAATLRKDEWLQYDQAVIREARIRLNGIADLESRGLVLKLNGMAKTVLETEKLGEFTPAELSMDGISKSQGDRPVFGADYLPLPIVHKDFFLNARVLAVSRQTGETLDVTGAELATRQVAEKMEHMLFNGSGSYKHGPTGSIIYGYLDFPSRNQGTLDAAWDASGATGDGILNDILSMKAALIADRFYGPYVIYIPTEYETILDKDFKAGTTGTIRQRLLQVEGISAIKTIDMMHQDYGEDLSRVDVSTTGVLMVQLTSDVVRIVNGMEITPVEWQEQGGMITHYKIMGIKVPQIRATSAGRCGIAHFKEP